MESRELAESLAQEMAKEEKIKLSFRRVNRLLEVGSLSFDQIFSILTDRYTKEEKDSVLKALDA